MPFEPSLKPEIVSYLESEGIQLQRSRSKWRPGPHPECGSSDALRVNTESGGGCCMSCGFTFGDSISFHMKTHGLSFVEAAKALGAWVDGPADGKAARVKPLPFSARDALQLVSFECLVIAMAACNIARGIELATADRERLVEAAGRIRFIAEEVAR
jgi:hypothetical protein